MMFSPKQLGEVLGISESSVKRWADEGKLQVSRTAGGHRRISLEAAFQFIRDSNLPLIKPHLLGLDALASPHTYAAAGDQPSVTPVQRFYSALRDGDGQQARGILLAMYLDGVSVAELCDGVVAFAMHQIGDPWKGHTDEIIMEHRATDICIQGLNQIRSLTPAPVSAAPVAVGGAPTGDPYLLGSLSAGLVLAASGWQAINLGAETPMPVLRDAAQASDADLVWLSVTARQSEAPLRRQIKTLADELAEIGVTFIVGGQALPRGLASHNPNLVVGSSMTELAGFVRGLSATTLKTRPAPV